MDSGTDWTAIIIMFIVLPLPFVFTFGFVAYRRWLEHREVQLMLEERKLLIEKGVTDLPALELPEVRGKADRHTNLKAGLVLVFLALAVLVADCLPRESFLGGMGLPFAILSGAIGLALLLIHFIVQAYARRNGVVQETEADETVEKVTDEPRS
ncbi:MAG: DUF6249 domain-containing protein [Armatimonadota bacterium]